jgi:hypothetical protein
MLIQPKGGPEIMKNSKSKAPQGKLSLPDARGRLARIKTDLEAVIDYLDGACCEAEAEELCEAFEPVENTDFMLEQLQ